MTAYTLGWLLWLLWFGVEEFLALKLHRGQGMTLSEHVWAWFAIGNQGRFWRLRRFALLSFLAWLCAHFLTGGRF